ncbi:hypothetical protein BD626DRAFT_188366 [Schizophyllum amplum]|uniref:PHD-zinc-finger like domain-containing protein n=1 Tax=Schizophyllum amplum TaxID=97359 RepID=A0A550C091_9AGAR|nr:hypothetical protein BD626DRAFT_188366 [Auriculariopsis ampla]
MARGAGAHHETDALPVVEFVKVDDDETMGVSDKNARAYGYNDLSAFVRPDHYIRHIEPLEDSLGRQVEYDMDEQDQEFLDALNAERKKEQLDRASYELFEIIMDRLEKEYFDLTKNIPKPDFALPSEDSTCAVCDDSEGENTNAIVFCDGCNLAVHQECYGVPYIPEGQWLCRKCTVSPENPVSCVLCPNEGGAFKQTVNGDWIHLLCAMWIPETQVVNETVMEPIMNLERVNKQRYKLRCSICENRVGACIQCHKPSCFTAFHPTCARKQKLMMPMKGPQGTPAPPLIAYCERHLPADQAAARDEAFDKEMEAEDEDAGTKSKTARAYAKTYKPGIPLVPAIVVERVLTYTGRINLRKKPEFVGLVCRYWSLKREARRGAPLLKRLHLEPWTASNAGQAQTEEERVAKLEQLTALKAHLEKVRELAALTCKRESRKLHQATALRDILATTLFYNECALKAAFEKVISHDRQGFFRYPVTKGEAPDYFDVVTKPMSWSVIEDSLNQHQYWDADVFKADIELVLNNALLYNKSATPFYKAAQRIRAQLDDIWQELHIALGRAPPEDAQPEGDNDAKKDATTTAAAEDAKLTPPTSPPSGNTVGDLEPALWALSLLVSRDEVQPISTYLIEDDPLGALFSYDVGKPAPPPPRSPTPPRPPTPPPPPSRAPTKKSKKGGKTEAEREAFNNKRRQQRAEEREARERELMEEAEKQAKWEEEMEQEARERRSRSAADSASSTPRVPLAAPIRPHVRTARAPVTAVYSIDAPRTRRAMAQEASFLSEAMGSETPGAGSSKARPVSTSTKGRTAKERPISSERPRKRRRTSTPTEEVVPYEAPSMPAFTADVGKKESFTFFNVGWTLPEGSKRGNRKPVERLPPPPPKKRVRANRPAKSRLSSFSTPASDNQTLPVSRSEARQTTPEPGTVDDSDERPREESSPRRAASSDQVDEHAQLQSEEMDRPTMEPSSPLDERMPEDGDEEDEETREEDEQTREEDEEMREALQAQDPSSEPVTQEGDSDDEEEDDSQQPSQLTELPSSRERSPRPSQDLPSSSTEHPPVEALPPVPPPTEQVPQVPSPPTWQSPGPYRAASTSKWAAAQDPGWAATAGAYSGRSRPRPAPSEPGPQQPRYAYAPREHEQAYPTRGDYSQRGSSHDLRADWDATSAMYASQGRQPYDAYSQPAQDQPQAGPSYWATSQDGYVPYPPASHADYAVAQAQSPQYASANADYSGYPSQYRGYPQHESSTYDESWPSSPQEFSQQRPFSHPSVALHTHQQPVAPTARSAPPSAELHAGGALELLAALAPSPQAPFSAPSPQPFAAPSPNATQGLPALTRSPDRQWALQQQQQQRQSTSPHAQASASYWDARAISVPGTPYDAAYGQWASVEPTPVPSPAAQVQTAQWLPQEMHAAANNSGRWLPHHGAPAGSQYASDMQYAQHTPVEPRYSQRASMDSQYAQTTPAEMQYDPNQLSMQRYEPTNVNRWQAYQTPSTPAQQSRQPTPLDMGPYPMQAPNSDSFSLAIAHQHSAQSMPIADPIDTTLLRSLEVPSIIVERDAWTGASSSDVPAVEMGPHLGLPSTPGSGAVIQAFVDQQTGPDSHLLNYDPSVAEIQLSMDVATSALTPAEWAEAPEQPSVLPIQILAIPEHVEGPADEASSFQATIQPVASGEPAANDQPEPEQVVLSEQPLDEGLLREGKVDTPAQVSDDSVDRVGHSVPQAVLPDVSVVVEDAPPVEELVAQDDARPPTAQEKIMVEISRDEPPLARNRSSKPSAAGVDEPQAVSTHEEEADEFTEPETIIPPPATSDAPPSETSPPARAQQNVTAAIAIQSEEPSTDAQQEEPNSEEASRPTLTKRRRGRLSRAELLARAQQEASASSQSRSPEPLPRLQRRKSTARRQSQASPAPQYISERAASKAKTASTAPEHATFQAPGVRVATEGAYDPLLPSRVRVEDDGVPVLEELDTPETRRARAIRQRQEREQKRREAEMQDGPQEGEAGPSTQPSAPSISAPVVVSRGRRKRAPSWKVRQGASASVATSHKSMDKGKGKTADVQPSDETPEAQAEAESELSSLSGSDDEQPVTEGVIEATTSEPQDEDAEGEPDDEEQGDESSHPSKPAGRRRFVHRKAGQNLINDRGFVDCGTLVWAKIRTYPWWPAVVYENDQVDDIPRPVLATYKRKSKAYPNNRYFIVRFFDQHKTWQVILPTQMVSLGDDQDLDQEMLKEQKNTKRKQEKLRSQLELAYQEAMKEMESDLEDEGGGK